MVVRQLCHTTHDDDDDDDDNDDDDDDDSQTCITYGAVQISRQLRKVEYMMLLSVQLLYGCETYALRFGEIHRLQVFDHRCLCSIGRFPQK